MGGFQNYNAWLQAFPSFPPFPHPLLLIFALAPIFRAENRRKLRSSLFAPRKRYAGYGTAGAGI